MKSYQLEVSRSGAVGSISTDGGLVHIPLSTNNRDCIQFIIDWKAGASVLNADGSAAPYTEQAVIALGLTPINEGV